MGSGGTAGGNCCAEATGSHDEIAQSDTKNNPHLMPERTPETVVRLRYCHSGKRAKEYAMVLLDSMQRACGAMTRH
jgi:hypothetical protein